MNPVPFTKLLAATRAQSAGVKDENLVLRQVSVDSRTLQAGDLFWALRGTTHDGHRYVAEALRRGALACVVERKSAVGLRGPLLIVDDTLQALAEFARWYRHQWEAL